MIGFKPAYISLEGALLKNSINNATPPSIGKKSEFFPKLRKAGRAIFDTFIALVLAKTMDVEFGVDAVSVMTLVLLVVLLTKDN